MAQAYVFGSVARGEDRPDSDLDLLLEVPADMGLFGLSRLRRELQEAAGVPVDLVPEGGLRPHVRKQVMAARVRL